MKRVFAPHYSLVVKILAASIFILVYLASCRREPDAVPTNPTPTPVNPPPTPADKPEPCTRYIQNGYTDKFSYARGEKAKIYLQSSQEVSRCSCLLFDMKGAVSHEITTALKTQTTNANNPSSNGFGYQETFSFDIPSLPSGVYLIENKIPIIIKNPSAADVLIIYPSNTANAYNQSGGKSLYSAFERPYKVSFHRPISLAEDCESCLKWLPSLSGITLGYLADCDLDKMALNGAASLAVVIGHSEYWTRKARNNFDDFIEKGGNAVIMSGNTMWWQVRYGDDFKELICYKYYDDPEPNELLKTVTWDKIILRYSILESIGADFNHGGYGLRYNDNGWNGYKIMLPHSPLLEGTLLQKGSILKLPSTEYDGAPLKGFDAEGYPVLDNSLHFYKQEILGFDKGHRGNAETIGTFIVLQKKKTSGIIINMASMDWCSSKGMGGDDSKLIKIISENAIRKLLAHQPVFAN